MKIISKIAGAALVAGAMFTVSAPAQAAVSTFAQFQTIGTGTNIMWKNNGTTGSNGTGGSLYTTATSASNVPGARNVSFSLLQPAIAPYITDVAAKFTLNATVAATPAMLAGGFLIQSGIAGSFSFLTTSVITIGSNTYGIGSNLLSATFNQAAIVGQRLGTSGSVSTSTTSGATIVYTSDFLNFVPTEDRDFALSLTSISGVLQAAPSNTFPNRALRNFKATATGSFSSNPAPLVTAVPEPAVWGMMIVGFGMVGLQSRRRSNRTTVSA